MLEAETLHERMPKNLPFYGEGTLAWVPGEFEAGEPEFSQAVVFRLQALDFDTDLLLACFFENSTEESQAMEIGNLLASRLVSRLDADGLIEGGMISPPAMTKSELSFFSLLLSGFWMEARYELETPEARHPILVRVLPATDLTGDA